jgi:anaerobic selenocysteine-containing dehydrogenase
VTDLVAASQHRGAGKQLVPGEFRVVLGGELARMLGVRRGDVVTLIAPTGQVTPAGVVPRIKQMLVAGTFDSGHYEYDSALVHAAPRGRAAHLPPGRPHGHAPEAAKTCTRPAAWRWTWRAA